MIDVKTKTEFKPQVIEKAVEKTAFRNFQHAAASISKDAKASISSATGPSSPGTPPHTHKRANLRKAIRFDVDATGAVIGPIASVVGQAGAAHEFGGNYKGEEYPERPFMGPALERGAPRFAGDWAGSLGE